MVDNIFEHVRHAMLIEAGANGNVFAYNHSTDPYWEEGFFPANAAGDIVLHGDHPYLNLFEGNIVQNIVVDDSHGANGPFNTLFRNRADLWGLVMNNSPASDSLNIVGNDITGAPPMGLWLTYGNGHFIYGNLVQSEVTPPGTGDLVQASCYAGVEPLFLQAVGDWPQTGPNHAVPGTIPAVQRTLPGADRTPCSDAATAMPGRPRDDALVIFPVPFNDRLRVRGAGTLDLVNAVLTSLAGDIVMGPVTCRAGDDGAEMLFPGLSVGAYILVLTDRTGRVTRRLVTRQ